MEKKKLLLVAVSVGVFLTIIISSSILIFAPKNTRSVEVSSGNSAGMRIAGTSSPAARPIAAGTSGNPASAEDARTIQPVTVDAADLVRNSDSVQNIMPAPTATAIHETNFYINGAQPAEGYQIEKREGDATARVVINIPRPSTAAVPDTAYQSRTSAQSSIENKTPAAAAKPAEKPAAKPAQTAAQTKPAAQAKPAAKTYNDYWVQTGAFSAKANAEGVKETLAVKGITSIIDNREIDGKTWYRVRVGPYTSENEAKYWLALVQTIDGFTDSQIRQTTSIR